MNDPAPRVRLATLNDLDGLKSFDEWDAVSAAQIRDECVFVAGFDALPVAFGILDRSFFKRPFVAILFVHPEYRKRGLGGALLQHFESLVADETLWISTNLENVAMQSMLHKHAFTLSGVVNDLARLPELVYSKPPPTSP